MRTPMSPESEEDPAGDTAPSRSQLRREALAVTQLAQDLANLPAARLARVQLPEEVRAGVAEVRSTPAHGAHLRALKHLAKVLRAHDEILDELASQVQADRANRAQAVAELRRLEVWRERLLNEGDAALTELVALHPDMDRQRLRALIRSAHRETERGVPPRAYREILRLLREL